MMNVADLTWFETLLHQFVLTFKKAPASKDDEGDEEV